MGAAMTIDGESAWLMGCQPRRVAAALVSHARNRGHHRPAVLRAATRTAPPSAKLWARLRCRNPFRPVLDRCNDLCYKWHNECRRSQPGGLQTALLGWQ